jgi:hypothetical protein
LQWVTSSRPKSSTRGAAFGGKADVRGTYQLCSSILYRYRQIRAITGWAMALMVCEECGGTVSDKATACPNCGAPVQKMEIAEPETGPKAEIATEQQTSRRGCFIFLKIAVGVLVLSTVVALCSDSNNQTSTRSTSGTRTSSSDAREAAATFINLNGFLCAEVTSVRALQLKDTYEITCIEYRGGSSKKTYIINTTDGTAFAN